MITTEEENRYAELQQMALDAARTGDNEMLAPMLGAGMPVGLVDEKGNSLLMLAAYHGNLETVRLLLKSGATPDQRNHRLQTPLAGVAFKGELEIVKLLIESGADPNADQGGGRFPIHFAALFGHREIVEYLEKLSSVKKPARLRMLTAITGAIRGFLSRSDRRTGSNGTGLSWNSGGAHAPSRAISGASPEIGDGWETGRLARESRFLDFAAIGPRGLAPKHAGARVLPDSKIRKQA